MYFCRKTDKFKYQSHSKSEKCDTANLDAKSSTPNKRQKTDPLVYVYPKRDNNNFESFVREVQRPPPPANARTLAPRFLATVSRPYFRPKIAQRPAAAPETYTEPSAAESALSPPDQQNDFPDRLIPSIRSYVRITPPQLRPISYLPPQGNAKPVVRILPQLYVRAVNRHERHIVYRLSYV